MIEEKMIPNLPVILKEHERKMTKLMQARIRAVLKMDLVKRHAFFAGDDNDFLKRTKKFSFAILKDNTSNSCKIQL